MTAGVTQLHTRGCQGCYRHQKLRERPGTDSTGRLCPRECGPADTSMLDFQTPELQENRYLLFKAPQLVVLRSGSPGALRHKGRQLLEYVAGKRISALSIHLITLRHILFLISEVPFTS